MTLDVDVRRRRSLLIQQYGDSPRMRAVIDGLLEILQSELVDPLVALGRHVDPVVAQGAWLDHLGERLGYHRPLVADDVRFFGFRTTGPPQNLGFGQGPFRSTVQQLQVRSGVGDAVYRRLLSARALYLRSGASRASVEPILDVLYDEWEIVESDLSVLIRGRSATTVLHDILAADHERLIPRAAGVAVTVGRMLDAGVADRATAGDTAAH